MKQFLAIFIGSDSGPAAKKWNALSEEKRNELTREGKTGWMNWVTKNQSSMTNPGSPLGKTKQVNASGISETKNQMCAFTIVQAESHEAAAKLFINHPHFTIFPGDSVEIMECMPIPGM